MRLYLYGAFILYLVSVVFSNEILAEDDKNQNSLVEESSENDNDPYDEISDQSYLQVEHSPDANDIPKNDNVDESVAYWQSIYGTEDVPDFQIPPEIEGESIYVELSEFEDSSEDPDAPLIKRTIADANTDFSFNPVSAAESLKNFDNSWQNDKTEDLYRAGDNLEPVPTSDRHDEELDPTDAEDSDKSDDDEMEIAETRSILPSRNFESHLNTKIKLIQGKKDLIGTVTSEAHRAIDAKRDVLDSLTDAKADLVDEKMKILHTVETGALSRGHSPAVISSGKLPSYLNEKVEKKKEIVQGLSQPAAIGRSGSKSTMMKSILESKADAIEKKAEIIHSATVAGLAKVGQSNSRIPKGSQADKVESFFQEKTEKKNEILHSATVAGLGHGYTHPVTDALGTIIEEKVEKTKEIIASAGLGHSGTQAGKAASILDAKVVKKIDIVKSSTIAAPNQPAVGGILESKSDVIGDKIELAQSVIADVGHGPSHRTRTKLPGSHAKHLESILDLKTDAVETKKEIISATAVDLGHALNQPRRSKVPKSNAARLESVLNLKTDAIEAKKEIISATAAELGHALNQPRRSKVSNSQARKLDSVLDTKSDIIEKKVEIIAAAAPDLGRALNQPRKLKTSKSHAKELESVLDLKADLGHALNQPRRSKTSKSQAVKLDSASDLRADVIEKKAEMIAAAAADLSHVLNQPRRSKVSKSNAARLESVLDLKTDAIEAKKEIISATAAELGHALNQPRRSKSRAEKLDTVLDAKADIIEKKVEVISATAHDLGRAFNQPKKLKVSKSHAKELESVLDLKADAIEKKTAIISSTAADLGHALNQPRRSKVPKSNAARLESVLDLKTDVIEAKKEIISATAADLGHALNQPRRSKVSNSQPRKLDSVLDSTSEIIEKKAEIIAETASDLAHTLNQPRRSKVSKSNAGNLKSVLDAKADIIEKKAEIISATAAGVGQALNHPKTLQTLKSEADNLRWALNSNADDVKQRKEFIHSATVAELGHAISQPKKSKISESDAAKLGSILDLKTDTVEETKEVIDSVRIVEPANGFAINQPTRTKVSRNQLAKIHSYIKSQIDANEKKKAIDNSTTVVGFGNTLAHLRRNRLPSVPQSTNHQPTSGSMKQFFKLKQLPISGDALTSTKPQPSDATIVAVDAKKSTETTDRVEEEPSSVKQVLTSRRKDDLETIQQQCATGQCGITGKLYVELNSQGEHGLESENLSGLPALVEDRHAAHTITNVEEGDVVVDSTQPRYQDSSYAPNTHKTDDYTILELPTPVVNEEPSDSLATDQVVDREVLEFVDDQNQAPVDPPGPTEDVVVSGLPVVIESQDSSDLLKTSEEDDEVVPEVSEPSNQLPVHSPHPAGTDGPGVVEYSESADLPSTSGENDRVVLQLSEPPNQPPEYSPNTIVTEDRVVLETSHPVENSDSEASITSEENDRVNLRLSLPQHEHPEYLPIPIAKQDPVVIDTSGSVEYPNSADSITTSEEDDQVLLEPPIPKIQPPVYSTNTIVTEDEAVLESSVPFENSDSEASLTTSEEDDRSVPELSNPQNQLPVDSSAPTVTEDRAVLESPVPAENQYHQLSSPQNQPPTDSPDPIVTENHVVVHESSVPVASHDSANSFPTSEAGSRVSVLTIFNRNEESPDSLSASEEDDFVVSGLPVVTASDEEFGSPVYTEDQHSGEVFGTSDEHAEVVSALPAPTLTQIAPDSLKTTEDGKAVLGLSVPDLEDELNEEDESSTYEDQFVKHYSNAADQPQQVSSHSTEQLVHFQSCFDGSSTPDLPKDVEYYPNDGTLANSNCRLINLDVNCSGLTAFMRPECQQLNVKVWQPRDQESGSPITLWTVKTYMSHGQELAIEMQNRAKWLCNQGLIPQVHTPAMLHLINNFATEKVVEINQESEFSLFGTKLLQRRFSSEFAVTPNTFVEFLQNHAFRVIGTGLCHQRPKRCESNQLYRSFDGACNNQDHPTWGQCNTAFARILPARYYDGVHEPPKSVLGIDLPNPRAVTLHCFSQKCRADKKISLALVQWGQLLSHDLAMQTIDQTVAGGIQCCADGNQLPKKFQHHSCLPIDISGDDRFYSKFQTRCMNFVRSMTISREDCTLGPADQLNTVTSYLDASPLYGSNKDVCDKLRAFKDGRMSVSIRRGRELLPTTTERSRFCDAMSNSEVCYLAGDVRVNQNPQLAILQTILLREHNRIADQLCSLNPHWEDERIFQESRKIVIAQYQHITYNEWLHVIVGKKYCQKHRLMSRTKNTTMSTDYDSRIKASTINGFSTAAFRFFHSMVQGNIDLCPVNREISHTLRLSNHFFRPQIIERSNNLDDLIRGLVSQPMQEADENFHPEISEYLFRSRNEYGMDLSSFDIQRGRDHGLASYNAYRKLCGLKYATNFDDLIEEIEEKNVEKLKSIYAHVNDIDLIVGLTLEKKSAGSILGPTIRCIISEQFYRSKVGDRYFYDLAGQPHSFTQVQYQEIRKTSLARLLCDNGDHIKTIQPRVFKLISQKNPLVSCCDLPRIDLSAWRELNY